MTLLSDAARPDRGPVYPVANCLALAVAVALPWSATTTGTPAMAAASDAGQDRKPTDPTLLQRG